MITTPEVSRATVEAELPAIQASAIRFGWDVSWNAAVLSLTVVIPTPLDADKYVFEFRVDNYPALPPLITLIHPTTGERNTHRCYPKGGRGYFHNKPCLCAPWNRSAYASLGGPHGDWDMRNWASARPNHSTIGDILWLLNDLLTSKATYEGRMAP